MAGHGQASYLERASCDKVAINFIANGGQRWLAQNERELEENLRLGIILCAGKNTAMIPSFKTDNSSHNNLRMG
jgi:hypothetical protein